MRRQPASRVDFATAAGPDDTMQLDLDRLELQRRQPLDPAIEQDAMGNRKDRVLPVAEPEQCHGCHLRVIVPPK